MSFAQPSESTTIYACPQCGVDGVFGYLNKDGDLIWYCADHRLQTSLHQPPGRIAKKQSDGRSPAPAICRGGLGVAGSSDLSEFVLTHHHSQHDFAVRASLA